MQAVFLCEQFMEGTNKYALIYADPAWSYDNKGSRAKADNHYPTMSITDLKRMPVWDLAADDAILAMWWVPPMPLEAIQLAEAWGFKVKNMCLFSWHKLNKLAEKHMDKQISDHLNGLVAAHPVSDGDQRVLSGADILAMIAEQTRMGLGNYTRSNVENVLVAVKGKGLPRLQADIKQMVMAPIGEHSVKPTEIREALEKLYGDVKRIELFSRSDADGWDHWGNEAPSNSVELRPGNAIIPANDNHEPTAEQLRGHLAWLVRETEGEWFGNSTHIARDGLSDYLWANEPRLPHCRGRHRYHWFTKAQYLERKAELQNNPSFADHPDAKCFVQTAGGAWYKNKSDVELVRSGSGATLTSLGVFELICRGEVLGDWRNTLERRPESDLQQATSQAGGAA